MSDGSDLGFILDLDRGVIDFEGGYSVPILSSWDRNGEMADSREETVVVVVRLPGDGMYVSYDLRDFPDEVTNEATH